MSIHPDDYPKPITSTRLRRRNSDLAIASTLLAVAVMLGVGITAFSSLSLSRGSTTQATTTGQGTR